jgi:hypothetical protein
MPFAQDGMVSIAAAAPILAEVIAIVEADANDLAGIGNNRRKRYLIQGIIRAARGNDDLHLVQVKSPQESRGPWDLVKLVATVPPDQAYRSLDRSKCSLVGK